MKTAFFKKLISLVLAALFVFALPVCISAADASVSVSAADTALGKNVSVKVAFSASDIGAASATLEYDPSVLQFVSGTDAHSSEAGKVKIVLVAGSAGKTGLNTTLVFKTLKLAETSLSINSSQIIAFGTEKEIGRPTALETLKIYDPNSLIVESLSVTVPARTAYPKNGKFDTAGFKVTAKFKDGHTEDVTAKATVSGFDSSSVGEKTVNVSYGGKSADFNVHIFGFKSAKLTLSGKIIINFTVDFGGADKNGYTMGALFFRNKPTDAELMSAHASGQGITEYGTNDGYPMFGYDDITSKEMNDLIYCAIYAEKGDKVYFTNATSMSAAKYVGLAFNNYSDTKLRTMLVDMLNYGSAAQTYFGYRTGELANSALTSAQKKYGSTANVSLNTQAKSLKDSLSSENVKFRSASLTLENEISVNYSAAIMGGTVKKAELLLFDSYTEGGTYDKTTAVLANPMELSGDVYKGKFTNLTSKDMRKVLYVRVHVTYEDGTEEYSNIYRYSIETYAHTVRNGNYAAGLKNLTESMMRYGDSASKYFV